MAESLGKKPENKQGFPGGNAGGRWTYTSGSGVSGGFARLTPPAERISWTAVSNRSLDPKVVGSQWLPAYSPRAASFSARTSFFQESWHMAGHRRLKVSEVGEITVVRVVDQKILDEASIQELGQELFALVEEQHKKSLLLNFTGVEFLSSAALGKLITLHNKVKASGGRLKLSNIRPEIYEVFVITRLNKLFDIRDDEAAALVAF
jgi:anti-sigma B factor antagonist